MLLKSKLNCFGNVEHSFLESVRFFFSLIHENNNLVMRSPANSPIETRYRDVYTELTVVVFIWEIRICVLEARILGSMWENGGGRVCREWGIWYLPVRACDLAYFGT